MFLLKRFVRFSLLLPVLLFTSQCLHGQQIPAMGIDAIINRASSKDTVYIVNFWATWCAPCVQELPVFNSLQKKYADKPVKVLLVSMDFKEDYPMKLATFIQRKKLLPDVIWLSDTNPNDFVPKVDKAWEGSIPATVIVHKGSQTKEFIEGQVTEKQVAGIVDGIIR